MKSNQVTFIQKGNIEIVEGRGTHQFPFHTHQSFMIGIILEGTADFKIGNEERTLKQNGMYLVPSNVGISIRPRTKIHYITVCIRGKGQHLLDGSYETYYVENRGMDFRENVKAFLNEQLDAQQFIECLQRQLGRARSTEKNQDYYEWLSDVIDYIHTHIEEKLCLDDLAAMVYVSKYHLVRTFKKEMGIGPMQYMQMCRIRAIRENLKTKSEAELAYQLQFSNQGHLCTTFKKYMGITPKTYKENLTQQ